MDVAAEAFAAVGFVTEEGAGFGEFGGKGFGLAPAAGLEEDDAGDGSGEEGTGAGDEEGAEAEGGPVEERGGGDACEGDAGVAWTREGLDEAGCPAGEVGEAGWGPVVPTAFGVEVGRFEDLDGDFAIRPVEAVLEEGVEMEGAEDDAEEERGWVGPGVEDDGLEQGEASLVVGEGMGWGDAGFEWEWPVEGGAQAGMGGESGSGLGSGAGEGMAGRVGLGGEDNDPLEAARVRFPVAGNRGWEGQGERGSIREPAVEWLRETHLGEAGKAACEVEPSDRGIPVGRGHGGIEGDLIGESEEGSAVMFDGGVDPACVAFGEPDEAFAFAIARIAAGEEGEDAGDGKAEGESAGCMAPRGPGPACVRRRIHRGIVWRRERDASSRDLPGQMSLGDRGAGSAADGWGHLTGEAGEAIGWVGEGFLQGCDGRDDGVGAGEEGSLAGGERFDAAGEADAGTAEGACACGDAAGALAHERLPVEGTLTGEHDVGLGDELVELGGVGEDVEPGRDPGAEEGLEGEAQAAGGAGAWAGGEVVAEVVGEDVRELGEGGFGCGHVFRTEALLGTVDGGAAGGAEEWVVHVHGDGEPAREGGGRGFDPGQAGEVGPSQDGLAGAVEEAPAEGACEPEPGVIGGAAADADPAFGRAGVDGVLEDGAEPEGIEVERMELAVREEGEADDLGGLDHGDGAGRGEPPGGGARASGGVGGVGGTGLGLQVGGEDAAEAVAAIAHWNTGDPVAGVYGGPALGDGLCGLVGGEGTLELVGHDEDVTSHAWEEHGGGDLGNRAERGLEWVTRVRRVRVPGGVRGG